ncbi:putative GPI-anchored protein-like isoform X1 [Iris pallida]|uniref:GPI-anchored protein-like isoform X1 n=1 Tax=Iris pallida TaxID=29817 RepID=A0AAX6H1X4_IRIPA|nr:putative GPI-anchored protein-like isoform X1 [Iris pallida]
MGGQALLLFPPNLRPLTLILLLICVQYLCEVGGVTVGSTPLSHQLDSATMEAKDNTFMPKISPNSAPEPLIPFLAPSPLAPFFNNSPPKLSGQCTLNFSAVDPLISTTAVDCWASFAPFLANVICCPQLQATLVILIGQSSKESGMLALDSTHGNHCLSDVQQILGSQGASYELQDVCSIQPENLTEGSCPVNDINGLESVVDSSQLLAACKKVDPVNECCSQICQKAILDAATKMASRYGGMASMDITDVLPEHAARVDDCRSIVLRWLSSRLDPLSATEVLRRLSNCNVNKVCPLTFEDTKSVADHCGDIIKNHTACCKSMSNYVSHLQKQSFITNLQALDCASLLGSELEKMNITTNIYSFCHITLKDFSLQVGSQESGCLLPSLPSDATFDPYTGISFTCDLNDNIAAPWPSASQMSSSSCNKTVNMPALPAATSSQTGGYRSDLKLQLHIALVLAFVIVM